MPRADVLLSDRQEDPSAAPSEPASASRLSLRAGASAHAAHPRLASKRIAHGFALAAASPVRAATERTEEPDEMQPSSSKSVVPEVFDGEVFAQTAHPDVSLERQERQEAVDAIQLLRQR